jgi:hypothetical protein
MNSVVTKYFKNIEELSLQIKSEETLVDSLLNNQYNLLIARYIKSRTSLIDKCEEVMTNHEKYFRCKEDCAYYHFRIKVEDHFILDDNNYPTIPDALKEYLNDTYDPIRRRVLCRFNDEADDDDYIDEDEIIISIYLT